MKKPNLGRRGLGRLEVLLWRVAGASLTAVATFWVDLLAERSGTSLPDLIARETSPRVRQIAQCRLLVAETFGR